MTPNLFRLTISLRRRGYKTIPPGELRVLQAIVLLKKHQGRVTIRDVRDVLDMGSTFHVATVAKHLREMGLISYNEHQAATIVPRVRFIPAEDL